MKRSILLCIALMTSLGTLTAGSGEKYAFLKSMVLPGWGEYAYRSESAYIFWGAEAALWLGFGALRYSASVQDRDLLAYTRLHADVGAYPEDAQYWADLGNYSSREDHRETMLENRTPERIWSSEYGWEWDSAEASQNYRDLYRKKELTLLSSEFLISGFIVNRIASAVNVKYLEKKGMQLSAFGTAHAGGGSVHLGLSF